MKAKKSKAKRRLVLRDSYTYTDLKEAIEAVNAKFQGAYLDAVDRASKEVATVMAKKDRRRKVLIDGNRRHVGKKGAGNVQSPKPR